MQKDLHLAALTAYEQGVALPTTNLAKEIYLLAVKAGLGEQDFSAMYEYLRSKPPAE
jgi:glyoxylate/succinic semialdehyde reductase